MLSDSQRQQLREAARQAALNAYAPYSRFRVGAAVLTDKGLFHGANVENASYGLTICAERVALFAAKANGARDITGLAVACIDANPAAGKLERMPCGACRQVALELLSPGAEILVEGLADTFTISDLLPLGFQLTTPAELR